MLLILIVVSIISATLLWKHLVENKARLDIKIPESQNIFYNNQNPIATTTAQIVNEFEQAEGKPVLLYLYTSWCGICKQNFPIINEITREFQNTNLKVIAIAIDRDIDESRLSEYLNSFGNFYFQPRFLSFKDGFKEFLAQKKINYRGIIPFTVLISGEGKVVLKYSGIKKIEYLRSKVIGELYL